MTTTRPDDQGMTSTATPTAARMFAVCPRCKTAHAEDIDPADLRGFFYLTSIRGGGSTPHRACKACGHGLHSWDQLNARFVADKRCDGRCLNARRASCECSCGGENHGAGNL